MNDAKYRWVLYIIIVVITATIGIQAFWNYKSYLSSKQQLLNDIQVCLDNSVDAYYANLAEKTTYKYSFNEGEINENVVVNGDTIYDRILQDIDIKFEDSTPDTLMINNIEHVAIFKTEADTIVVSENGIAKTEEFIGGRHLIKTIKSNGLDSLDKKNFELLTAKIMMRISNDTIDIKRIKILLKEELIRKNINVDYNLSAINGLKKISEEQNKMKTSSVVTVVSKSSFLPMDSNLKMSFYNISGSIFKRIFVGVLISTLLVLAVIFCLFYLLKIIKNQKQLAEIKNDFISNITHEFKTPIATIGVALESISDFNVIDDKEKTKSYLAMSNQQLSKLNEMVEKLLETAALDSEKLEMNTEKCNIATLVGSVVEKHQLQATDKSIVYKPVSADIMATLDVFHFENTINNLIDNALKYGGDTITVDLKRVGGFVEITVSDNGTILSKYDNENIFEKFYRVPNGNTHNVKGFGIGLYYAKKIIEKHRGTILLDTKPALTSFKISLPL